MVRRTVAQTLFIVLILAGCLRSARAHEPVGGIESASYARVPGATLRSVLTTGNGQALQVEVGGYSLQRSPVTNAQFLAFVRSHVEWRRSWAPVELADSQYLQHWRSDLEMGPAVLGKQPVTHVSWFAAQAYCRSRHARLPSWHEWELAAAADEHVMDARRDPLWQQRILNWYSIPSSRQLPLVGRDRPNLYGIHDLHGLVWEWVEDFNALFIADDPQQASADVLRFCGAGADSVADPADYPVMMRLAMLSSLKAGSTTANVGFRCALPGNEAYHRDIRLESQDGHRFKFETSRHVRIVTMFYSSCSATCPLTIDTLRAIEQKLTPAQRAQLDVLLITFDPERDTREVLRRLARERRLETMRWTLARAGAEDTRELSQLLDIAYRRLGSGAFSHTSALILMDRNGHTIARTRRIGDVDPKFLAAVHRTLDGPAATLTARTD